LLLWFLGAIVLAIVASAVTTALTNTESGETSARIISRHMQRRLARIWDDPQAADAYVTELRETTGLDLYIERNLAVLGDRVPPAPGAMIFEKDVAYFPVVRSGEVVGALALRNSPRPQLWRAFVALGVAVLVLGAAARRVSKRLARPLEHLAQTATRFGGGNLAARTGIDMMPRRWVAEEVRDVGRAFDGMADRIARVVVEQRELLAAISHELRSPLGRARIAIEIAREQTEAEPRAVTAPRALLALDDVDRELVEVDAILGDLLASARAGLADLRGERQSVVPWLRARVAQETSGPIELTVMPQAEDVTAEIDSALLGRAVHNLFTNAWAHGHPRELPIEVEVSLHGGRVKIAVRDQGPGFPVSILARAFDAFVTGDDIARSPRAHGMGLGLALVRRIVEAHGGAASAANLTKDDAVVGAEVTIELPACAAE